MIFRRDRYLIVLSVVYFVGLGVFLMGCKEGTEHAPMSAIMGNYAKMDIVGSRVATGIVTTTSSYRKELEGIKLSLFKLDKETNEYVYIDKAVTGQDGETAGITFSFKNLTAGDYRVVSEKTNIFESQTADFVISDDNTVVSTDDNPVLVKMQMVVNTDDIHELNLKVVSAHTGAPIENADIKYDGKRIPATEASGLAYAFDVAAGYHNVTINAEGYSTLDGKFQIDNTDKGYVPSTIGNGTLVFSMVEKDQTNAITGVISDNKTVRTIKLYKYSKVEKESTSAVEAYSYDPKKDMVRRTNTSYGITGKPFGSFKFTNLPDGIYMLYVCSSTDTTGSEEPAQRPVYRTYDLGDSSIDDQKYKWIETANTSTSYYSRPLFVRGGKTIHWNNIEQDTRNR